MSKGVGRIEERGSQVGWFLFKGFPGKGQHGFVWLGVPLFEVFNSREATEETTHIDSCWSLSYPRARRERPTSHGDFNLPEAFRTPVGCQMVDLVGTWPVVLKLPACGCFCKLSCAPCMMFSVFLTGNAQRFTLREAHGMGILSRSALEVRKLASRIYHGPPRRLNFKGQEKHKAEPGQWGDVCGVLLHELKAQG